MKDNYSPIILVSTRWPSAVAVIFMMILLSWSLVIASA